MTCLFGSSLRPCIAALGAGIVAGAILAIGAGIADTPQPGASSVRPLKDIASFGMIADIGARSRAIFAEAAKVITDPRCINCHPANRVPTQGNDLHPHVPFINAGESGIGADGLNCQACHRDSNTTLAGSRIGSIPGASPWLLAPQSMGWQGLTLGEICRQLKDLDRNGGRSLADLLHHVSEDHLVGWAWHPGKGRRPAPGTQQEFGALIGAWIETGAQCPS